MTASLDLKLQPGKLAVPPGQPATIGVRVVNTGLETLELTLRVAGLGSTANSPVAALGSLAPGAALTTAVQFTLPVDTAAGDRIVAIQVVGTWPGGVGPDGRAAEPVSRSGHVTVQVGSTSRVALRLARAEVEGRVRGKLVADLHNQGTETLDLHLWGEGKDVRITFEKSQISLAGGTSQRVLGTVKTGAVTWRRAERRAFVITAQGNTTPATTAGSYVQKGLLPGFLTTLLAVRCRKQGSSAWIRHAPPAHSNRRPKPDADTKCCP